jgi:RNA polymerase sigma-B factor
VSAIRARQCSTEAVCGSLTSGITKPAIPSPLSNRRPPLTALCPPPTAREIRSPTRTRGTDAARREAANLRRYATDREPAVHEQLVHAFLPLANAQARHYRGSGHVPLDDLEQVAAIGLLKAIDRFDPDHGANFSSFAVPTIRGELRRYFRDRTWSVRVPRDLQERAVRVAREREEMYHDLRRAPTAAELGERMGCTAEEILDAIEAVGARSSTSFDTPGDDPDAPTLGERLGAEEAGYARVEAAATADSLLSVLTERDRRVVELRFHEDLTQAEIGAQVGCSQMHVSRILRSALAQLTAEADGTAPPKEPSWLVAIRR